MEVKTNYEFIKKDEKVIRKYIQKGLIPVHIMTWRTIYEYYLVERESNGKMQSYSNTAENYKVNECTVRNIVYWMNSSE